MCRKKEHKQFVREVRDSNPDYKILGKYKGSKEKILVECKKCHRRKEVLAESLLRGYHWCPCHQGNQTSFTEQYLSIVCEKVFDQYTVVPRDKKTIGMELDIYLPEMNAAIEFGAYFWHKDKFERDHQKTVLCRDKDIKLITVYDSMGENAFIPEPFRSDPDAVVLTFEKDLAGDKDLLRTTAFSIALALGLTDYRKFYQIDFDEVIEEANRRSGTNR